MRREMASPSPAPEFGDGTDSADTAVGQLPEALEDPFAIAPGTPGPLSLIDRRTRRPRAARPIATRPDLGRAMAQGVGQQIEHHLDRAGHGRRGPPVCAASEWTTSIAVRLAAASC